MVPTLAPPLPRVPSVNVNVSLFGFHAIVEFVKVTVPVT